ncbi:hypothetical protein [Tengunoibacter tsumagoiensis]|uniref:Uncharacterized protein n=1 Tax=Tengunoibacter tsumagoiensis TaxID=2014871 RepID=A0A402A374_9CHLR|nr:hypothetical protein [Tengunoibacter tsumagoiensis]GCE13441.1 hypothetical protein KTT_33000 [Tengunoibacter tsumagoiensis]
MGQYRQWLYYREVDRKLRAQLALLENEFSQLHQQMNLLENDVSFAGNKIIQALISQRTDQLLAEVAEASEPPTSRSMAMLFPDTPVLPSLIDHPSTSIELEMDLPYPLPEELPMTSLLSPTFSSDLPIPEEDQSIADPSLFPAFAADLAIPDEERGIATPLISTPDYAHSGPEKEEQFEDLSAFVHTYNLTDPQIPLPWWLRNAVAHATQPTVKEPMDSVASPAAVPVNQQSRRTDRLVERWFERWGQQPDLHQSGQKGTEG